MIFGEIESFITLAGRAKKLFGKGKSAPESIADRFLQLFENHGVHHNQIPRFFDHGLSLTDVKDDESLLLKLDEEILNAACDLFAVRREWLDGADNQIYPLHDFYKHPEEFIKFALSIKQSSQTRLGGVLVVAYSKCHEEDALLILEETVGFVGDKPIYRYHICFNWIFKYWKARAYLTACIALGWKNDIYIRGVKTSIDVIECLREGSSFLNSGDDTQYQYGKRWHPEDMAVSPEVYLDGIDPGTNDFGIHAALTLWLELHDEGLMGTGTPHENVRENFASALMELHDD